MACVCVYISFGKVFIISVSPYCVYLQHILLWQASPCFGFPAILFAPFSLYFCRLCFLVFSFLLFLFSVIIMAARYNVSDAEVETIWFLTVENCSYATRCPYYIPCSVWTSIFIKPDLIMSLRIPNTIITTSTAKNFPCLCTFTGQNMNKD